MSANAVYTALQGFIQTGANGETIDLWSAANGSDDLSGLLPVLALFGINASYVLSSPPASLLSKSPDGGTVTLLGSGTFHQPGATDPKNIFPVNASLNYVEDDGGIFSLSLRIASGSNWTFSDFFPSLPDTLMEGAEAGSGIFWQPSFLTGMKLNSAMFSARSGEGEQLQLSGFLPEPSDPRIVNKAPMIGPWPLRLQGNVVMPDETRDYPLLELDARGADTVINGQQEPGVDGPAAITLGNPGLTLIIAPLIEPQGDRVAFSTLELFGNFSLSNIRGRMSTLILSTGSTWSFTIRFDKETASLVQGLAQLTNIFGVTLPVPMNFPVLSDFYIGGVDVDLHNSAEVGQMPSFTLQSFAVTIRSDKEWVPPVPYVTLSNVGTRWVWSWTIVNDPETGGQKKTYSLTGSVFGSMNFGGNGSGGAALPPPTSPPSAGTDIILAGEATDNSTVTLNTRMDLPNFYITGYMAKDNYIPIGKALEYFFGNDGPSTGPQSMNITRLRFTADPIGQNYFADASILFGDPTNPDPQQGWEIDLFILTIILQELDFYIRVNNGQVSGGISGVFFLDQDDPSDYTLPRLMISAEYPPQNPSAPAGWTLAGGLYPGTSISLTKLVYKFIYGEKQQVPDWVPDLSVDRLSVVFTTGSSSGDVTTNPSYLFGGTISARWQPQIFGTQLKINASASLDMEKPATSDTASGQLTGTFSINKIALTASLTFGVPEPTYLFKVQVDQLWLQATTAWRTGKDDSRHQVVSLQLGGVTLGDMLEYFVNLAAPTIGFKLDPPWDVLKRIDLSRFVLTLDPQENVVEFVFNADVDLVVAKLNSIGVRYTKDSGQGKVDLILTGNFIGQEYGSDDPLSWDVINDPPPAVPGGGESFVNLRYLGLGQRVTFNGPTPGTVAESIATLRKEMQPPKDPDKSPLEGQGVVYSSESEWLIGLDIQLLETVDLGFIFNDPKLYGLSIALGGERAGSLAGLRFEILYKKITNDIGMFRIEFQLPDMFRTIQLGVVSLTIGIVVIEIYTNGNFKIDLGFPYNRNFDRSFSLQAYVFIGRGGFYLGVLNGDTSTQVPRITNGNFSPVIELGIGIAAGVGREIREGILAGGAYVELEVLFQGVLAWFNPNSSGAAPAKYFKCQGIAALHGKIYGSVDFVVVKVSVTLEAYAQVSVIYECYQPTVFDLSVDVSARASVKILFVRVHFSFNVHLDLTFTIGSAEPTPWILDSSSQGNTLPESSQFALLAANPTRATGFMAGRGNRHRRMQVLRHAHTTAFKQRNLAMFAENNSDYVLNWQPDSKVFPDSPRHAHMTLLPAFSIGNVPVNWNETVPDNAQPDYRSAFVLFADTGMSASAVTAAECCERSAALSAMTASDTDTSKLAADILTQGLSLYTINAFPRGAEQGNTITAAQLEMLLEQLTMPDTMSTGFDIVNLATFFNTNINIWLSGEPTSDDPHQTPDEKGAMVVPMPPFLQWASAQAGDVDFSNKNKIGSLYEWGITQLLNTYFPVGADNTDQPGDDNPDNYESFTSFMFRDFCLMVAQNAVKQMQKNMNGTTVTVQTVNDSVQNLEQVAATLPTATVSYAIQSGDTIESVAEALGATAQELEFLNPSLVNDLADKDVGTVLQIKLGIAPEILAFDNIDEPFALTQCDLGTVVHQAADDDTLKNIAGLFQVTDIASLLRYSDNINPVLRSDSGILQPGSTFDLPQQTFADAPADFQKTRTAAVFFIRYTAPGILQNTPVPAMANWYAQAIANKNQDKLATLFPNQAVLPSLELPPGETLSVPDAYTRDTWNDYTIVNGDTLTRIGYALTLEQDYPSTSPEGVPQWQTFLAGVTSGGASTWTIPAQDGISVQYGETIEALTRRLIVDATWTAVDQAKPAVGSWSYNWAGVAAWIAEAKILAPLASVTVPNAKTKENQPLSFGIIAKTYGLAVGDAAARLKGVPGLYESGTILTVKFLPAQDIDVLVDSVLRGDSFVAIVNQSSRMLMAGLQLPGLKTDDGHTVPDPANPLPLYDLTGQQFSLPIDAAKPDETALALALTSQAPWISLMKSITVSQGQTLAGLEADYPDLLTYNPGLSDATFKVGMVLLTEPLSGGSSLDYNYTNQEVVDASPETGLSVVPIPATPPSPAALPLSGVVPRTYGLEHRIDLQTPVTLPIPQVEGEENVSGLPALWMFPAEFQAKAEAGVTTTYQILHAERGGAAGAHAQVIEDSTYGMLLPFRITRLDDGTARFALLGVDTDKRGPLLSLRTWLEEQGGAGTEAYLLLEPAPNAGNTSGLTVLSVDPQDVYLIKTNLSTESVPQPPGFLALAAEAEPEAEPVYYAPLDSLDDFLLLLWEGSVVGGTGYYFGTGQNLPASAFDEQGNITLQLLVIAGTQQGLAPDGRALLPFNNCALTGPGLDAGYHALFIESAGSTDPSETLVQALVPPGNVGFTLLVDQPVPSEKVSEKEVQLKNLYSLLTFSVAQTDGSPFSAPASGMPVMPQPSDGSDQQAWQKARARRVTASQKRLAVAKNAAPDTDDEPYWRYQQVLPVSRFVLASTAEAAPDVAGLPMPGADPYRGFGTLSNRPLAKFVFGFGDVLGNRTAPPSEPQGCSEIPVGYTDPLIGLAEWPSIARSFNVAPGEGGDAMLDITLSARPSELLPAPAEAGGTNADALAQQIDKYRQIYYQLAQPDITGWIVSSLKVVTDETYGNKGQEIDDIAPLWRFAAGAYANASSVASMVPAEPENCATLGDIVGNYGIRYTELAQANAQALVHDLFGGEVPVVPAYYPFVEHGSVTTLMAMPPKGWPVPAEPVDLLTAAENTSLPLKNGTALTIPAKTVSTGASQPTPALQTLADANNADIVLLANGNSTESVLQDGFEFSVAVDDEVRVIVTVADDLNSLDKVVEAYAGEGVNISVSGLAQLHKDRSGMFATDKDLALAHYVVRDGDTLASNHSGATLSELAGGNVTTKDIFDPGALVWFGNFSGVAIQDTPSLQAFADRYACPAPLLLHANADFALSEATRFTLPGTLAWPADTSSLRVPYTLRAGDMLNTLAGRFNLEEPASDTLVQINENMPGTLKPNIDITVPVDGKDYTINSGEQTSFSAALAALQAQAPAATLHDLTAAIGGDAGVLQPGALLLCPEAKLPKACSPSDITGLYGISAAAFGLANAAMQGLIVADQTLYSPDGKYEVKTIANDTVNSLIIRFAAQDVSVDASGIFSAEKNQDVVFMRSGANALLPPAPVNFAVNIGQGGPYAEPIVPLQVSLRLIRPPALIHPDFNNQTGPVAMVESAIPAPTQTTDSGSLTFDSFVGSMKAALPDVRLATGRVKGVEQDLWCIDFDSNGIASVALHGGITVKEQAQPRFFALKPLYRYLVTRTEIDIAPLADTGLLGDTAPTTYQGIDAEIWARRFFTDMDRFLSGTYAAAMYASENMRAQLVNVLTAKNNLLPLIAGGLDAVLDVEDSGKASALANAKLALQQHLGVSLSRTYETAVLIQYDSQVQSAWQQPNSELLPASLYGDGGISGADQNITITSAKTQLADNPSYVNFLLSVDNPALHRDISGIFEYDYSHIEFNISSDHVPDNYVASDWLTFMPLQNKDEKPQALAGTNPGEVDIPVPLRTFPDMPILARQAAVPAFVGQGGVALNKLSLWDYELTYSHQHAEQDYVVITAEFNLSPPTAKALFAIEDRDLFTELAQYNAVADTLWDYLNGLVDKNSGVPAQTQENAVHTFATLAANIAQYWAVRLPRGEHKTPQDNLVAALSYDFNSRVTRRNNDDLASLTLTRLQDDPGPNKTWPDVYTKDSSGKFVKLDPGSETAASVIYSVPDSIAIPAGNWPVFNLVWNSLNVAKVQNARGKMLVKRNQNLLDNVASNPEFIFTTDKVIAPSVVTPLNNYGERVDITALGSDLASALQSAFSTLFGDALNGQPVTIELSYGFELVPPRQNAGQGLVTYLPIALYPNQTLSDDTGTILSNAVDSWKALNKPSEQGGEWVFSMKLYSKLANSHSQVLMTVDHLIYRISN